MFVRDLAWQKEIYSPYCKQKYGRSIIWKCNFVPELKCWNVCFAPQVYNQHFTLYPALPAAFPTEVKNQNWKQTPRDGFEFKYLLSLTSHWTETKFTPNWVSPFLSLQTVEHCANKASTRRPDCNQSNEVGWFYHWFLGHNISLFMFLYTPL